MNMDAEELTGSLKKLVMWYKVKELKSKGLNKTQIARCLGINRNTVRKYQSMSESEFMNSQSYRRNYNHKLDPYEDFVHKKNNRVDFESESIEEALFLLEYHNKVLKYDSLEFFFLLCIYEWNLSLKYF